MNILVLVGQKAKLRILYTYLHNKKETNFTNVIIVWESFSNIDMSTSENKVILFLERHFT